MRIRAFTTDDYEAVAAVWDATEGMSTPTLEEVERKLERDPELFVVAEDGDEVVGVAIGTHDGWRGYVFRLAVAPQRRGEGIGAALVADLERRFAAKGVDRLRVLVHRSNPAARAFWEALGYDAIDDVMMFAKDG
jgi:ribosomal protein S18 acetylase RimI-like enzyme